MEDQSSPRSLAPPPPGRGGRSRGTPPHTHTQKKNSRYFAATVYTRGEKKLVIITQFDQAPPLPRPPFAFLRCRKIRAAIYFRTPSRPPPAPFLHRRNFLALHARVFIYRAPLTLYARTPVRASAAPPSCRALITSPRNRSPPANTSTRLQEFPTACPTGLRRARRLNEAKL